MFFLTLLSTFVSCVNLPDPSIRIGLVRAIRHPESIVIVAPVGAKLTDPFGSSLGAGPAEWQFRSGENGVAALDSKGKVLVIGPALRVESPLDQPNRIISGAKTRAYRGAIEIRGSEKGLAVINELPLESYLRGVIAAEMSPSAGLEALKAQTICARSFAVKSRGKYRAKGYDLSDDVDCQVYNGVDSEKTATDAAVRETAGQVLRRKGEYLLADYYDDCGGITSPGERDGDYPPSVHDGPESGGSDFCVRGRYHAWTLTLAESEMRKRFPDIGEIKELRLQADSSGRARKVDVMGETGSKQIPGYRFRAAIGYTTLRSTLFTVSRDSDGRFTFSGRGNGHGHGLCQEGAMGMAAPPYNKSCKEIIQHYFPGAEIVTIAEDLLLP